MGVGGKVTLWPFYPRRSDTVPIVLENWGAWSRSGRGTERVPPLTGFAPRTDHPLANRYTNSAIPAASLLNYFALTISTRHFDLKPSGVP